MPVKAIAINCSLKKSSGEASSTDAMIALLKEQFAAHEVEVTETVRIADYNVLPGVTSDEGEGDDWPELREKILAHDILIFGGPIWMGQIGSIAKRVLERMDAFLGETDEKGRMPSSGKVAVAACYWVGEAMGSVDFKELDETPDKTIETAKMVATNASHLAKLLQGNPYPGTA